MTKKSRERRRLQRKKKAYDPYGRQLGDPFFHVLVLEVDFEKSQISPTEFFKLSSESTRSLWWSDRGRSPASWRQSIKSRVNDIYGFRASFWNLYGRL
jgi:hypothetical protein